MEGQAIVQEVGVHPDIVLAVKPGVLDENASTGPKIQVPIGGEEVSSRKSRDSRMTRVLMKVALVASS